MNTTLGRRANSIERFSVPVPQTHPDRLATIARLFGVNAKEVSTSRVLELGCANAGNLIAAASTLPNAKFVGVDESEVSIQKAKATAKELGLKNVEFHVAEGLNVSADLGQFDYIIANGLFSWVSKEVQERVFDICKNNLTDNGVALISYNTYPGWHFRGMIRDMMKYHAGALEPAQARAQQSRALLDFLAQAVPVENNAYGLLLRGELAFLSAQPDNYLLQDLMAESNEPFYFHQFTERAQNHGLQYLGEAEFSTMLTSNFPPSVAETIRRISDEIVRTEQYMDFVRNRAFRQTLLCKSEVQLNRNIDTNQIRPFMISSPLKPENPGMNVQENKAESFLLPNGVSMQTANPLSKAALLHLSESWPRSVSFDELLGAALARLSDVVVLDGQVAEAQKQVLANDLMSAYAANAVLFRTEVAPFITFISERPKASELTRHQAAVQDFVTNQLHEIIAIDPFSKQLLTLLNGSRDKIQILDELVELVKKGQLVVQRDGKPIADNNVLRQTMEGFMQECLEKCPRLQF